MAFCRNRPKVHFSHESSHETAAPTDHVSHERWLVSYADFVTLLFAFFVVLYASAQIDKQRAARLSDAIDSAFQQLGIFERDPHKPGEVDPKISLPSAVNGGQDLSRWAPSGQEKLGAGQKQDNFNALRSELENALAAEIARNEVALHMEADGLVVSLREAGFFDSGSATIKPGAQAAFARVANILREHSCAVRIEGHTDNVPIHTAQFASNWELSTARATSLVKAADRCSTVSRLSGCPPPVMQNFIPPRATTQRKAGNSTGAWML